MTDHVIGTVEALRSSYGEPSARAVAKSLDRLDRHCRRFIALSPFVVLASAGADGRVDCSPRGDPAGFVAILDDRTVLLPDRLGNNRVDSLRNVLENPQVGMLFMIPGGGRDAPAQRPGDADHRSGPARAARGQWTHAAQRAPDRGGRGLSPVHQGPGPLPALGGGVAGGPQGRPPAVRTDACRSRGPARWGGGGSGRFAPRSARRCTDRICPTAPSRPEDAGRAIVQFRRMTADDKGANYANADCEYRATSPGSGRRHPEGEPGHTRSSLRFTHSNPMCSCSRRRLGPMRSSRRSS